MKSALQSLIITTLLFATQLRTQAQIVNIPDYLFLQALLEITPPIDKNNNYKIEVTEAESVTFLNISNKGISSLTGISAFTNLRFLECTNNDLTSIDVSKNKALIFFTCYNNKLTYIDVSQNTSLRTFGCENNNLDSLNVSNNNALSILTCFNNQILRLDPTHNLSLNRLDCANNKITKLDLSKNTALSALYCGSNNLSSLDVSNTDLSPNSFSCAGNPNLFQICINNSQVSKTSTWSKDASAIWSTTCGIVWRFGLPTPP